jgi:putative DNA primase/helicase
MPHSHNLDPNASSNGGVAPVQKERLEDTFEHIAQTYELRHEKANKYRGFCPVHHGTSGDSFSVELIPNDRILIKCFGDCDNRAIVKAMGLEMSDLFADSSSRDRTYQPQPKAKPAQVQPLREGSVTWYPYKNDNEELVYRVRREDFPDGTKKIRPYEPGSDKPTLSDHIRRYPYNLRALKDAKEKDALVFFGEGEKPTQYLIDLDLRATCVAGGADGWKKYRHDYMHHFEGLRVVILPDNDEPGKKFAEQVYQDLKDVCKQVAVVPLPGLKEPGEDVVEWIGKYGHAAEELQALAEGAFTKEQNNGEIEYSLFSEIEEKELEYLFEPYIQKRTCNIITGIPEYWEKWAST